MWLLVWKGGYLLENLLEFLQNSGGMGSLGGEEERGGRNGRNEFISSLSPQIYFIIYFSFKVILKLEI